MTNTRRIVQFGFLSLTLIGVFALGANAERWCPMGGVEALYTYLEDGTLICSLGVSNFFILGGVLATALILRRAFCGYACPIGTISAWLDSLGQRLKIRRVSVPAGLDRALAPLKYLVLAAVLAVTWRAGELLFRSVDPCYALISRHGEDITPWAYVAGATIAVASLFLAMPFCRWLCPMAAVLAPFSRFALARVKRDAASCSGCKRCTDACPMAIPVDRLQQVNAASCLSCFRCVEACPRQSAGALCWGPPGRLGRRWPQVVLPVVLLLCLAAAVGAAYAFPMASFIKVRGTPSEQIALVELKISNVECRGRANRLLFFLLRDDMYQVPGYLKLEAWPGPGKADVRISYDPTLTDELAVKRAITEPYHNVFDNAFDSIYLLSPFEIEGYDPLGADAARLLPPLPP